MFRAGKIICGVFRDCRVWFLFLWKWCSMNALTVCRTCEVNPSASSVCWRLSRGNLSMRFHVFCLPSWRIHGLVRSTVYKGGCSTHYLCLYLENISGISSYNYKKWSDDSSTLIVFGTFLKIYPLVTVALPLFNAFRRPLIHT